MEKTNTLDLGGMKIPDGLMSLENKLEVIKMPEMEFSL